MSYMCGNPLVTTARATTEGIATVAQTVIPISGGFSPGLCDVYVGGAALSQGDYDDSDGMSIVLAKAMALGTQYKIVCFNPTGNIGVYVRTSGDTMSGPLKMNAPIVLGAQASNYTYNLVFNGGSGNAPSLNYNYLNKTVYFADSTNAFANLQISDAGNISARGSVSSGSTGTFTGALTASNVNLNGAYPSVQTYVGGALRYYFGWDGGQYTLNRYNAAGTYLNTPLAVSDANGGLTFALRPTWAGFTPWDTGNRSNPTNCSTSNLVTFDWGANYAGQIGVKIDSSLMGYMITTSNVGSQLCYTAAHLRTGGADSTWNWSGQGGQPSWVWGGNDPSNMYVYNPSNFSVNWATAAGSVGGVTNPAPLTGATFSGPVNVVASGDPNGYQGTLGGGYFKLNEWNYGPYIDLSRARSEDFQWRIHYNFNNGYLEFIKNGGGSSSFTPDGNITTGNIYLSAMGDWISNTFNGKANNGAQVQWNSGIREFGTVSPGSGDVTADAGAPWMLEGLRCTGGGATWIWPRAIWCRNQ